MKKFILISILLLFPQAHADLLYGDNYVSPETYAVNEADMQIDYSRIPPAPKLNVDNLDDMRFNAPELVEKEIPINEPDPATVEKKSKKQKETIGDNEAYKKKLTYKFAKWWVDQRYKREEEHHGSLHEIKVQKRIDYEQKLEEEKLKKLQTE